MFGKEVTYLSSVVTDISIRIDLDAVRNVDMLAYYISIDILYTKLVVYQISPKWIIVCKLRELYT
jgi:hypothetical protein